MIRINHRIRVPELRVVGADGEMLGVMPTKAALERARAAGLDLVEVNPKSNPPVAKILDYGKFKYDEKKKQREAKRKQTIVEVKEIKLRPKTDDHDINVKIRKSRQFLADGNKVKLTVRFRGREITHPEIARAQLELLIKGCEDLCNVETRPSMEGRTMTLIMAPKPQVLQKLANEKAARAAERAERQHASSPDHSSPDNDDLDDDDDDDDDDDLDDDDDDDLDDDGDADDGDADDNGDDDSSSEEANA